MEKFSIIVIKPNQFNLNDIKFNNNSNYPQLDITGYNNVKIKNKYINFDHLKEMIKDYVIIDNNVTIDNLMEKIVKYLEMDSKWTSDIRDVCEDYESITQIICVDPNTNKEFGMKNRGYNYLATLLTYNNELVDGPVILLRTNLPINSKYSYPTSISLEYLSYLLLSNNLHTGVLLSENNKVKQIYFDNNNNIVDINGCFYPDKSIRQYLNDKNYEEVENYLYKFNLNFFVQKENKSKSKKNIIASKFLKKDIYGDVVITSKLTPNIFGDITERDINNMIKLIDIKYKLTEDELKEETNSNGLKVIKSKFRILNEKLKIYYKTLK
jgi:hypothetical protein